jgi:hypothetical protein
MSYKLNKTDGTLLVDLIDGFVDTDTTNLTLIGRNYTGFGELLNENFIKLLENFSNTASPSSPLRGQLWYDTTAQRLKVYNGTEFVVAGGPFVQQENPQMVAGDLWINNLTDQLYFFDGSQLTLAGPIYTTQQGVSGFQINSILDIQSRTRVVAELWIGGTLTAVVSNLTFTPAPGETIPGIDGDIKEGINPISSDFKFYGTADSAVNLISESGDLKNVSQFLPADENGTTTGTLTIQNSGGLTIGPAQNNIQKIVGTSFVTENQLLDYDYKIRLRSSGSGSVITDALTIKSATQRVGIFQGNPAYNLDVTGDMRVTGNLLVEGETTSFDVTTLRVEDKNIELAISDGSSLEPRSSLDSAGIIIRATGDDISLTYELSSDTLKSSEDFNLADGKEYKINNDSVLSQTTLGNNVLNSNLENVGVLTEVQIDEINIDGTTISSTGGTGGINLTPNGDIAILDSNKITGLADPTSAQDAATKNYVDTEINSERVVFSLDVTGLSNTDIEGVIESLHPASGKEEGTLAVIHGVTYSGTVTGIDVPVTTSPDTSGAIVKSFIAVDSNGTQNASVVQDISFSTAATGTVALNQSRSTIQAQKSGGVWQIISTVAFP